MKLSYKNSSIKDVVFILLATIFLLPSCSKNDTPNPIEYKAYVSHDLLVTKSGSSIKTLFQLLVPSYPEIASLVEKVEYNVSIYSVTYKTGFMGEEIEASGLVCIPVSDNGVFPMISFQNGTNTSHEEAPTKNIDDIMFRYLQSTASIGYIMLIPDYIGFGKSEQFTHPYLHKESTVKSVENLITATQEMMEANLINVDWDNDLYLMGYSQGGWATLCTHKDIVDNPELGYGVTASSCGAGPYDLSVVQNYMFEDITYPQPVYMAYTGVSYHSLGLITNPLTEYFNEPYASNLPSYFSGEFSNGEINEKLNDTVSVLVAESFLTGINTSPVYKDFRDALYNNSVFGWNTSEPIRLYHGTIDNYVPYATTEQVYDEFIDAGAVNNVALFPLQGDDHATASIPMVLKSLLWFDILEMKNSEIVAID
jgi:hypothetical protein